MDAGRTRPAAGGLAPVLLAVWVALQCATLLIWIERTNLVFADGDTLYLHTYAHEIQQMLWGKLRLPGVDLPRGIAGLPAVLGMQSNFSSAYPLLMGASIAVFGPGVQSALYPSIPFLALLLAGLYVLGARLGDRWTGLFAALFAGMLPGVLGIARSCELYHPLSALIPWLFVLMLSTDRFRRTGRCLALGIVTGLAVLVKGQVAFFVGVPYAIWFCLGLVRSIRERDGRGALRVAAGGAVALAATVLVSAVWWAPNLAYLTRDFFQHAAGHYVKGSDLVKGFVLPFEEGSAPWTAAWALKYARVAVGELTPFFAAMAALGLAAALVRRREGLLLPVLWVGVPYVLLTAISGMHHSRYYFPAFPGMALIAALGVHALPRRWMQGAVVFVCLAVFAAWIAPRSVDRDLFPQAAQRLLTGSEFLTEAVRTSDMERGEALEPILARHPAAGNKYVAWLLPGRMEFYTDHSSVSLGLMERSDDRVFCYNVPTRTRRSPLTADECRRRVNTWLVWDPATWTEFPEAVGYEFDENEPVAVDADGTRHAVDGLWEAGWAKTVAQKRFLGAARLRWADAVVWAFADARSDDQPSESPE